MTARLESEKHEPEVQLRSFLEKFDPRIQKHFRAVRSALRKRFPTATELAYDYADSLVIAYSPTDRPYDASVSIAAREEGVRLYVMSIQGKPLPDPKKLLQGSGKQARFVPLDAASQLALPDVKALIAAALDRAKVPFPSKGKGSLIIRSDAAKRQARKRPTR